MKRAIYVGPDESYPYIYPLKHPLHYGMTGYCPFLHKGDAKSVLITFYPHGSKTGTFVDRELLYVPAEDQTRHCPKPNKPSETTK